jgi:ribosomal protein S18 acetylase RimI-like enzyme
MKVKFRRTTAEDLDNIYDMHTKCFHTNDLWYKSAIKNYLSTGIVIELTDSKEIIGVLLQGEITPCNVKMSQGEDSNDMNYMGDVFEPLTDNGKILLSNKIHYRPIMGIVMICVHPKYRNKGLAQKLIEKHFIDNKDMVVCLNTRRSNISAYTLYKKMGYEHVAYIKNKYFLPNEDAIFMINDLTDFTDKNIV